MVLTASCRVIKEVPVETTKVEYRDRLVYNTDSVYIRDSISVKEKQDTVFIEKYRTIYRDKLRTDSVFIEKRDSVDVPIIIQKELSKFQKSLYHFGIFCAVAIVLVVICYIVVWIIKRRR
jgi:hypothetical protein